MLKYLDTPILEIRSNESENQRIKILVKREDLNSPHAAGNKWWKLKYNLEEAKKTGHKTILTFGGAFSNHLYATAATAREAELKSIGIVRGEEILPLNTTLSFAQSCGMKLHFVSRAQYSDKASELFINGLKEKFGEFYLIPEGGSNSLAVKGCAEFATEKLLSVDFDFLALPVGTGGTMAGIITGFEGKRNVVGFSVLKNGNFLNEKVRELQFAFSKKAYKNWSIETDFHFGGYAKQTRDLNQFIAEIKQNFGLPLDPVYTGKMAYGVFEMIKRNQFPEGSTILILHTGGLRPDRYY
jgi:1-aminocyclopropane-1-carboxylate deaminase